MGTIHYYGILFPLWNLLFFSSFLSTTINDELILALRTPFSGIKIVSIKQLINRHFVTVFRQKISYSRYKTDSDQTDSNSHCEINHFCFFKMQKFFYIVFKFVLIFCGHFCGYIHYRPTAATRIFTVFQQC